MIFQHSKLASGKWFELPFFEQMANLGSEVERAILWRTKNADYRSRAFERALELLDLTIADEKNRGRLREIVRLREILVDFFYGNNQFSSSDKLWRSYFYPFNWAARINH